VPAPEVPIEAHLDSASPAALALFERFRSLILRCGPTTLRVTKTSITFKGARRGFAGARPHQTSLRGYLDLQRPASHPTVRAVAPYTERLFVHQFIVREIADMDDAFAALVAEAYAVGAGAHLGR
jgi:Domain of unknown function (DUF5655)